MADKDIALDVWLAVSHGAAALRRMEPCPYLQGAERLDELARIVAGLHRAVGIKGVDIIPFNTDLIEGAVRSLRQVLRTLQVEAEAGRERVLALNVAQGGDDVICMTRRQFTALLRPVQEPP